MPALAPTSSVLALAESGCTAGEIADALGLAVSDVEREIATAGLSLGEAHASRVELALYSRAVGMTVVEERLSRTGEPVELTSQLPPDVPAAKAVLAALRPERWRNDGPQLAVQVNVATFGADGARLVGSGSAARGPAPPVGATLPSAAAVVGRGTSPPHPVSVSETSAIAVQHNTPPVPEPPDAS